MRPPVNYHGWPYHIQSQVHNYSQRGYLTDEAIAQRGLMVLLDGQDVTNRCVGADDTRGMALLRQYYRKYDFGIRQPNIAQVGEVRFVHATSGADDKALPQDGQLGTTPGGERYVWVNGLPVPLDTKIETAMGVPAAALEPAVPAQPHAYHNVTFSAPPHVCPTTGPCWCEYATPGAVNTPPDIAPVQAAPTPARRAMKLVGEL